MTDTDDLIASATRRIARVLCKHRQCKPLAAIHDSPHGALLLLEAPGRDSSSIVKMLRLGRVDGRQVQPVTSQYVRRLETDDPWTRQDVYCRSHGIRWLHRDAALTAVAAYRNSGEEQRIRTADTPDPPGF